jgi:transposase-like protein
VKNSQGRSFKDKTSVLGMSERRGKLVCRVVDDTSQKSLTPHILETVKPKTKLYTDEWSGYNKAGKLYTRRIVDHSKRQYVNGDVHTNTIEGAWTILKRSYIGIYHYMSRKHLQKYVDEFVFHYNTRKLSNREKFDSVIHHIEHCITHKKLVA